MDSLDFTQRFGTADACLKCVCPLGLAHFAHLIWPTLSY